MPRPNVTAHDAAVKFAARSPADVTDFTSQSGITLDRMRDNPAGASMRN
jgi:hypothetical protein